MTFRQPLGRRIGAVALLAVAMLGGCNNDDNQGFSEPSLIKITGGADITGQVGTDLGPFVVSVVDTGNVGVPGVVVTFTITGPATLVNATATTNQDGSAFTSIQLGHTVGNVTITAKAAGVATPVVFHTSSFAEAAAKFTIAGGQSQSTLRGTSTSEPLSVLLTDQYDNPIANATVTWAASAGTVGTPVAHTTVEGRGVTTYTLPATPGAQTVTATTSINGANVVLTFNITGT